MRIIPFKDLYYTDFNMQYLLAMNQRWENCKIFSRLKKNRETSALLYFKDCEAVYTFVDGSALTVPKGSVLYIPQNSVYITKFFACSLDYAVTQLIEFEATDNAGESFICTDRITIVANDDNQDYVELFEEAVNAYKAMAYSYAELKAVVYTLIARITKHFPNLTIHSKEFNTIAPAIKYLQKHSYAELSVSELADMCHISESCFRYLFKRYSGQTPSAFCTNNRMKRAKQLLRSDMYSIGEIAAMLGYAEPGYFSKVFKKHTGLSPKEYVDKN